MLRNREVAQLLTVLNVSFAAPLALGRTGPGAGTGAAAGALGARADGGR